ncbi:glycosyltransferase family 61 protein [Halorubrum sp. BOL3-1]|uniref:glycosyltransferase family 61 protein n=1 Tax=Halorubrum sp. BOL3-1 TaxID=2497325 RepID=UPI0010050BC8|nr:glycosyltransferase family 61 protein [Halorubrum sp. BOL3-1]QAU12257.1 glycosyltransferase family 61 protein [Halorubrum sp. BOL3-1]
MNTSYWKRLLANTVSDIAETTILQEILDKRTHTDQNLKQISVRDYSYGSDQQLQLSVPKHVGELSEAISNLCGDHHVPEWNVYELQDTKLVGPDALAITGDNRFVLANSLNSRSLLLREILSCFRSGIVPSANRPADDEIGLAVSLVGPWATGYFHWFAEYLPRLEGLRKFEACTGEKPTLIIPDRPPNWMTDSLSLLGYSSDRIVKWSGGDKLIRRLIIPQVRHIPVQNGYIHDPFGLEWVGGQLRQAVPAVDQNNTSQLYISRADADERRIVNEDRVMELLNKHGFSRKVLSDYSLVEQISMFQQVDSVVGPHGAGLINIMYSKGIDVIEIFGDYQNGCYYTMSGLEEVSYACISGIPVEQDIYVPPKKIEKFI